MDSRWREDERATRNAQGGGVPVRGRPPGWLAVRHGARGSLARAMLARDGGGFPRRGAGRAPARSARARAFRACSNAFVRSVRKCKCARPAGIVCACDQICLCRFCGFFRVRARARDPREIVQRVRLVLQCKKTHSQGCVARVCKI